MKDLIKVLLSWSISVGILIGNPLAYYFAMGLSIIAIILFLMCILTATAIMSSAELHDYYNSSNKLFTKKWLAGFLLTVPLYFYATISTGAFLLAGLWVATWVIFVALILTVKYLSNK